MILLLKQCDCNKSLLNTFMQFSKSAGTPGSMECPKLTTTAKLSPDNKKAGVVYTFSTYTTQIPWVHCSQPSQQVLQVYR